MHFRSRTFLTPYPHQHYFNTFYRPRPRMGGFLLLVAGGLLGYHIGKNHSKDFEKGVPWCRENREARWQRRQAQQGPSQPEYPPQDDKEKYEQWKQQAAETVLDTAERSLNIALDQVAAFRRQYNPSGADPSTPPLLPTRGSSGNLRDI